MYVLTAMNRHKEVKLILERKGTPLNMNERTVMASFQHYNWLREKVYVWFNIHSANVSLTFRQDGDTALHVAVLGDNGEMIDVLVKAGADFSIRNKVTSTYKSGIATKTKLEL